MCQLVYMGELGQKSSWLGNTYGNLRRKLIRSYMRALFFITKIVTRRVPETKDSFLQNLDPPQIYPGDVVRVRSKDEIKSLLDSSGKYKSCPFMDEMFNYCEKEYKVLAGVDYFFDESKQKLVKLRDIFVLEGTHCSGKRWLYLRSCDLRCLFFWHKDLFTKV